MTRKMLLESLRAHAQIQRGKESMLEASPPTDTAPKSVEQKLRDVLERMGIEDAQKLTSGDLVELANWVSGIQPTDEVKLPKAEYDALVADAERMKALCKEFDEWQPDKPRPSYLKVMPIWDAMCEAIGDGADGNALRQAIDSAKGK